MFKNIKYPNLLFLLASLFVLVACKNNEPVPVPPPTSEDAAFTYSVDLENPNKLYFTAQTEVETWYTHWSFGDNTAAEGMEAEKTFFLKGEYDVRYKIFTEGGTAESVQTVVIESDFVGPNLIQNGEFDGDDFWTVLPISPGMELAIENGTASWSGGGWGNVGIYQAITVEADQAYQINMDIVGGGLSDCWFEVFAGTTEPTSGVDYSDGGILMGINTWEGCGSDPFEGLFNAVSCAGGDGTFEFPTAQTVYIVIKGGGADYGATGITIDNVSVRPL